MKTGKTAREALGRRISGRLHGRAALSWTLLTACLLALLGFGVTSPTGASASSAASANTSASSEHVTSATLLSTVTNTSAPITVGALFEAGSEGAHGCSASVLDTPEGNLIVTAAHCLSGTGVGMQFVPGYNNGAAPYGTWTVTAAYAPQGWLTSGSTTDDMAVLKVADHTIGGKSRSIESVVGGEAVGTSATSGTIINAVAYASGSGGSALTCTSATSTTTVDGVGYPTFTCGSYPNGTSGGPWLSVENGRSTIVGLIGGLKQGGCTNETSYSAPLNSLPALVATARTSAGETLPSPPSSGC